MRCDCHLRLILSRCVKILGCALVVTGLLVSCGGGSGGGGSGSSNSVPKTPALSGTLDVFKPTSTILESEPNDTVDQTHFLGQLQEDAAWTLVGDVASLGGDQLDGYRVIVPRRLELDVSLRIEDGAKIGDNFPLALSVYDVTSMQYVQTTTAGPSPRTARFHAKGTSVLVVRPTGSVGGRYTLNISASAADKTLEEIEPNDLPGEALYFGELASGDVISIDGSLHELDDGIDRLLFSCPASVEVAASLNFGDLVDFDFVLSDATVDLSVPTEISRFETDKATKEEGSIEVGAMTLLAVEVLAAQGSGNYGLEIRASELESAALSKGSRRSWSPDKRLASLSAEYRSGDRLFAKSSRDHFGRVALNARAGEFLVGASPDFERTTELARRHCRIADRMPGGVFRVEVDLPENLTIEEKARFTQATLQTLAGCSGVHYCEPNYTRSVFLEPNDELYNLQWNHALLELPRAWDISTGDESVVVAVIDTGMTAHPDLVGRQLAGYDFISDPVSARDGDGPDPDATDEGDLKFVGTSTFHGTHVAAIIGAETGTSGEGIAGVAWEVSILPLRVAGTRDGTDFDLANAILFAAGLANSSGKIPDRPADIVNISLGGSGYSATVHNAVVAARAAGATIFAAAGNGNSPEPQYPASYSSVLSVGAVDSEAGKAPYSNYGESLDFVAPGGDRRVDLNGDGHPDSIISASVSDADESLDYTYRFYSGTSMACAHAAGIAALMLAVRPELEPLDVENILRSTAVDLGVVGRDDYYGHGLINAFTAVAASSSSVTLPPLLSLTTTDLSFVDSTESRVSRVLNIGDGLLEVYTVEARTADGGDWLSARRVVDVNAVDSDTVGVRLIIDAGDLTDGVYNGEVNVYSNGGSKTIRVVMRLPTTTFIDDVVLSVLAVNADTQEVVSIDRVNPIGKLLFEFVDVDPGEYLIFAGSDDNGDGIVCGRSDRLCGAFPSMDEPRRVRLEAGSPVVNLDFQVTARFADPNATVEGGFDLSD